jgi:hypothetical protein
MPTATTRTPSGRAVPTAEIIWAWPHSSSKGVTVYQTALHADGQLSCNCPGWRILRKGQLRGCHHTRDTPDAEIERRLRDFHAGTPMGPLSFIATPAADIMRRSVLPASITTDGGRIYRDDDE